MHNRLDVMGLSRLWLARLAFVRPLASFWNLLAHRLAWPYVELLIRLWIAKLFFLFGVRELMLWGTACAALEVTCRGSGFAVQSHERIRCELSALL
jgi:hypothetical protein